MNHTIKDFKKHCDDNVYDNQENFTRDQVKALLWSQIAIIYNDINNIIYHHMKSETIEKGYKLRNWNDEENDIMQYLKNSKCVSF
jgi:hypothetical protein